MFTDAPTGKSHPVIGEYLEWDIGNEVKQNKSQQK